MPRRARLVRLRQRAARGRSLLQDPGLHHRGYLPGRGPEGPGAPRRQADGRPLRRARRRAQDGDVDPRRRVVHRHRVRDLRRRRQEIRRGHARGERAAAGIPAGNADHHAQVLAGPGEHRADRAGVRRRAVSRARGLRARTQGQAQDRRRRAHLGNAGRIRSASCASRSTCGACPSSTSRPRRSSARCRARTRTFPRASSTSGRAASASRPRAVTTRSTRCATRSSRRSTGASCACATSPT